MKEKFDFGFVYVAFHGGVMYGASSDREKLEKYLGSLSSIGSFEIRKTVLVS